MRETFVSQVSESGRALCAVCVCVRVRVYVRGYVLRCGLTPRKRRASVRSALCAYGIQLRVVNGPLCIINRL